MRRLFVPLLFLLSGCSAQPPIVADPPQHVHLPPEVVPWEESYDARGMPRSEAFDPGLSDPHHDQSFQGELEDEPKEDQSSILSVLADVIAFPFRGLGWLIQSVM